MIGVISTALRQDHRRRREQQPQNPQRPRPRQQHVQQQPDEDRRQTHQCIEQHHDHIAAGKPIDRQETAQRQTDRGGDNHRAQTDAERQPDDADQFGIERDDQTNGEPQRLPQVGHDHISIEQNPCRLNRAGSTCADVLALKINSCERPAPLEWERSCDPIRVVAAPADARDDALPQPFRTGL